MLGEEEGQGRWTSGLGRFTLKLRSIVHGDREDLSRVMQHINEEHHQKNGKKQIVEEQLQKQIDEQLQKIDEEQLQKIYEEQLQKIDEEANR
ncbi:hypothetical protein L6452_09070 [Arctium lappa]|uniref:Uncharacterized protein n=1 Tax=Arctium lappa TaxID=4217 RepID=A0ACB9DJ91_ARCLA|nr:hypothetical protein L6452_09070 [Arctium lappa]